MAYGLQVLVIPNLLILNAGCKKPPPYIQTTLTVYRSTNPVQIQMNNHNHPYTSFLDRAQYHHRGSWRVLSVLVCNSDVSNVVWGPHTSRRLCMGSLADSLIDYGGIVVLDAEVSQSTCSTPLPNPGHSTSTGRRGFFPQAAVHSNDTTCSAVRHTVWLGAASGFRWNLASP